MDPNTLSNHQFQVSASKGLVRRHVGEARAAREAGDTAQYEHHMSRAGSERRIITPMANRVARNTK